MDLLQEVALKYGDLLNKDYLIKASYKKETIEICFFFLPEHFYHLVGFHKLLDMKDLRANLPIANWKIYQRNRRIEYV